MQMSPVVIAEGRVGREPWSQWVFPSVPSAHRMRGKIHRSPKPCYRIYCPIGHITSLAHVRDPAKVQKDIKRR